MIITPQVPALDYLLKKLGDDNGLTLTPANCTLDSITVLTGQPTVNDENTVAIVTAKSGADFTGQKEIKYHRLELDDYFIGITKKLDPILELPADPTKWDVFSTFGAKYGISNTISKTTIVDPDVKVGSSLNVTITTAGGDLVWVPSQSITINLVVDSDDLEDLIRFPVVDVFYASNSADPTKTNADVYSYPLVAVDPADTSLLAGLATGIAVPASVATLLTKLTGDTWTTDYVEGDASFTLAGAIVKTKGAVDPTNGNQNQTAANCISIELDYTKNTKFVGTLYLYWG